MDDFTLEAQFDEPRTPQADIKPGTLDLRCRDCMELMAEFPDKHFDLAIVDPPYGIGMDGGKKYKRGGNGRGIPQTKYKPFHGNDATPPPTQPILMKCSEFLAIKLYLAQTTSLIKCLGLPRAGLFGIS